MAPCPFENRYEHGAGQAPPNDRNYTIDSITITQRGHDLSTAHGASGTLVLQETEFSPKIPPLFF